MGIKIFNFERVCGSLIVSKSKIESLEGPKINALSRLIEILIYKRNPN